MRKDLLLAVLVLVAGCSSSRGPIIDTKGVDMARYNQDLAECQEYQKQVETSRGVAKGAVAGAAVGAAIGAVTGSAGTGAAIGGISGGARSAQMSDEEKRQVVNNCLRGRGYHVLN